MYRDSCPTCQHPTSHNMPIELRSMSAFPTAASHPLARASGCQGCDNLYPSLWPSAMRCPSPPIIIIVLIKRLRARIFAVDCTATRRVLCTSTLQLEKPLPAAMGELHVGVQIKRL